MQHLLLLNNDFLVFYPETKTILIYNDKIKYWDNFHIDNYANYCKRKFIYNISKLNMN